VQWLVSGDGIALVGSPTTRISILRDAQDRIARVTGPTEAAGTARTVVYRYGAEGRLVLARALDGNDFGTPYGYDSQGAPYTDTLVANLGTAANWLGTSAANTWSGTLSAAQTTALAFTVRARTRGHRQGAGRSRRAHPGHPQHSQRSGHNARRRRRRSARQHRP
jgi:hypothetical protein